MDGDLELRLQPFLDIDGPDYAFWQHLCRVMVKDCACEAEVVIETREILEDSDDTAFVEYNGTRFTVVLDERLPFGMVVDYLIHELAHVATWFVNERDPHGPHWGVEYARMYRKYIKTYEKFWKDE